MPIPGIGLSGLAHITAEYVDDHDHEYDGTHTPRHCEGPVRWRWPEAISRSQSIVAHAAPPSGGHGGCYLFGRETAGLHAWTQAPSLRVRTALGLFLSIGVPL